MYEILKIKYYELFDLFNINKKNGCLNNQKNIKFPTFPFIGSKYGNYKKILIIGLDIGSDEKTGGVQSFEERRKAIEEKSFAQHNPHIAGTYFTALFFLKDYLNFKDYWNKLKNKDSAQKALKNQNELPGKNPLSYIALTNYYKFVSVNRKNRTGGENRVHIDKNLELNFLLEEIKILNPDIIIFQSLSFLNKRKLLNVIKEMRKTVYVGPHPSYRGKREPEHFVKQIKEI